MELLQKALYLIEKNHTFLDGLDEKEADEVYNFLMSLPEQTESLQKRVEGLEDMCRQANRIILLSECPDLGTLGDPSDEAEGWIKDVEQWHLRFKQLLKQGD